MSRTAAAWLIGGIVALALILVGVLVLTSGDSTPATGDEPADSATAVGDPEDGFLADLYFPASRGGLRPEERTLAAAATPTERVRRVVEALLDGPRSTGDEAGLLRPFPEGVALRDVYLAGSVAFVDLGDPLAPSGPVAEDEASEDAAGDDGAGEIAAAEVAPAFPDPPASGSREELLRIYSVVETVTVNVPEVRRVVLLWNGVQRESFAGHVDTSRPLAPRDDLVAER